MANILHVVHVITDLDTGGAESMMQRIIVRSDATRFRHSVVSLTDIGPIGRDLESGGIDVRAINMSRRTPGPFGLVRLAWMLRGLRPDVVKSWLYHGDLAASLACRIGPRYPLVWGLHSSSVDPAHLRPSSLRVAKVCARLSRRIPAAIICDSRASLRAHEELGYDARKMVVIPNGFDTTVFRSDPTARSALLSELALPFDTRLVGLAARFDPAKDHRNFLDAARIIREHCPRAFFVLCGGIGIDRQNALLTSWIEERGLNDVVALLGRRENLPAFMAALDVGVSSSATESFPIMVGELMATAVPLVTTDAGDSGALAGDAGLVVPARDAQALAEACIRLLLMSDDERMRLGARGRQRILHNFRLEMTVQRYEEVLMAAAHPA